MPIADAFVLTFLHIKLSALNEWYDIIPKFTFGKLEFSNCAYLVPAEARRRIYLLELELLRNEI